MPSSVVARLLKRAALRRYLGGMAGSDVLAKMEAETFPGPSGASLRQI